jgi:DHA1 family tetracycline resistance protein-like MFS transporter
MSRQVPDDAQGELQGAINATNSLAAIIGPLLATQLFNHFTQPARGAEGYFPGAPFLGAGVLVVVAAVLFVYTVRRFDLAHRPPVAKKPHIHETAQPGQQATAPHDEEDRDDTRGPVIQQPGQ